jgi:hypothetical protein
MSDIFFIILILFFYALLHESQYNRYGILNEASLIQVGFNRQVRIVLINLV